MLKKVTLAVLVICLGLGVVSCGQSGSGQSQNSNTIAGSVVEDFTSKANDNDYTALSMAEELLNNPKLDFAGATMEVSEGPLMGFTTDITGFSEAAMFSPMIGSIPFIGYVFKLNSSNDVSSFIETLKENSDPRWNICTEAEDTAYGSVEDMVVFVMAPKEF